jgi:hypothetical protein
VVVLGGRAAEDNHKPLYFFLSRIDVKITHGQVGLRIFGHQGECLLVLGMDP